MDIKLNEDTMRELVSKTIFESITPEDKEAMLRKAIQGLLVVEQKNGYYGTQKVNLLEVFLKEGVDRAARKIIEDNLESDEEFKKNVEGLFNDVVKKLFEGEMRDKFVSKISEGIINNFNPRDY